MSAPLRWAVQWRSKNRLDGKCEFFMWDGQEPLLFTTRHEARAYIGERYGHLRNREDLKDEPFGWRLPKPVRVRVLLEAVT